MAALEEYPRGVVLLVQGTGASRDLDVAPWMMVCSPTRTYMVDLRGRAWSTRPFTFNVSVVMSPSECSLSQFEAMYILLKGPEAAPFNPNK